MEYTLKDKIQVTKEFLSDLEMKSWQEIENLQNQIANIEITPESSEVVKLLKNLLTSYYVFAGGLENLTDAEATYKVPEPTDKVCPDKELMIANAKEETAPNDSVLAEMDDFLDEPAEAKITDDEAFEPFEYFVDFDEPAGEPLTDDDLYN